MFGRFAWNFFCTCPRTCPYLLLMSSSKSLLTFTLETSIASTSDDTSNCLVDCECSVEALALAFDNDKIGKALNCCYLLHPIYAQILIMCFFGLSLLVLARLTTMCLQCCGKSRPASAKFFCTVTSFCFYVLSSSTLKLAMASIWFLPNITFHSWVLWTILSYPQANQQFNFRDITSYSIAPQELTFTHKGDGGKLSEHKFFSKKVFWFFAYILTHRYLKWSVFWLAWGRYPRSLKEAWYG